MLCVKMGDCTNFRKKKGRGALYQLGSVHTNACERASEMEEWSQSGNSELPQGWPEIPLLWDIVGRFHNTFDCRICACFQRCENMFTQFVQ